MKKNLVILAMMLFSVIAFSQVGINTTNPQAIFHIDGAKDNPVTGTPNDAQMANDFIVASTGWVGIGNLTPSANLHILNRGNATSIGSGEATNTGLLIENPVTNSALLSILRTTGTTGVKQLVMGINPNFNGNNGVFAMTRTPGGTDFAMDLTSGNVGIATGSPANSLSVNGNTSIGNGYAGTVAPTNGAIIQGNVGIATNAPTNTLDVAGSTRVRTMDVAAGATIITPVYSDTNGVLNKAVSNTYGTVINNTVTVAPGGLGILVTGISNTGTYKAAVSVVNSCGRIAVAEYYVTSNAFNNAFAIKGVDGLLNTDTTSKGPTFTEVNRSTTSVVWSGIPNCSGATGGAFNYTLTMPSADIINVTNNGDATLDYRIILTRIF